MTKQKLQVTMMYAMLIEQKMEGLMDCVWGFIDGTIRRMARPLYHQRSIYIISRNATV